MNRLKFIKTYIENLGIRNFLCGLFLFIFALYKLIGYNTNMNEDYRPNIYLQLITNIFIIITTLILLPKVPSITKKRNLILTIFAHIVMAVPLVIHFYGFYAFVALLENKMEQIPFIFSLDSKNSIYFLKGVRNYGIISGYISLSIALFTVWGMLQNGLIRISVVFHAIINIACVGATYQFLSDCINTTSAPPLIDFLCKTISVCVMTTGFAVFLPFIFRIRGK